MRIVNGETMNFIPGNQLNLSVNKKAFLQQSDYINKDEANIPDHITITIKKNYLSRDELLILDILANNDWERPVYAVYPSVFKAIGLEDYMHREGMVYRLLPYKAGSVLKDAHEIALHQYKTIKENFVWGNVNNKDVFLDHTNKVIVGALRLRQMFIETAGQLAQVNENEKAKDLLDMSQKLFPNERVPYSFFAPDLAKQYYYLGFIEEGNRVVDSIRQSAMERLTIWAKYENKQQSNDLQLQLYLLQSLIQLTENYNPELSKQLIGEFNTVYQQLI